MSGHPKENSAAMFGRQNFGHIRFSSTSKINNVGRRAEGGEDSGTTGVRRSLFDKNHL